MALPLPLLSYTDHPTGRWAKHEKAAGNTPLARQLCKELFRTSFLVCPSSPPSPCACLSRSIGV